MNRGARSVMLAVSVILSLLFLSGSAGIPGTAASGRPSQKGDAPIGFHGQPAIPAAADPSCQSGKCHAPAPHEKGATVAAFLNFHARFVDCLVCHGRSTDGTRVERKDPKGRHSLRSGNVAAAADPHETLATPTACRGCHSESGKSALGSRGLKEFPDGFENPMALRMIEERKDRWLPAGLR